MAIIGMSAEVTAIPPVALAHFPSVALRLLVGDHQRCGVVGHGLGGGEHGGVFVVEVLPAQRQTRWGGGGHRGPGFVLEGGGAVAVHVDQQLDLGMVGVEFVFVADHRELELVQHEELLRQVRRGGEPGESAGDGIDVARLDATNLLQRLLPGFQMPLRVRRQSDVRQP